LTVEKSGIVDMCVFVCLFACVRTFCMSESVQFLLLSGSLHASPGQQPPPNHKRIRKCSQGCNGFSAAEPITARPSDSQPVASLPWGWWAGTKGAAWLSLVSAKRIGQQRPRGREREEGGLHGERSENNPFTFKHGSKS